MAPETASPGVLELLSPKRKHYGSNFARIIVPDGQELTQADYLAASQAIAILETRARARVFEAKRLLRPKQPFFLAVGFVRPHVPSVAPKRLFDHYPDKGMKLPHVPKGDLDDLPEAAKGKWNREAYGMNEQQQRQARAAYFASVEFMDEQVGRLLDTLDRLNLRRNTVVIFTSDHGFNLGEHEIWQKLNLFEESIQVPLIVSAPGFEASAGKSSEALVELIDLYPTIADLTGLAEIAPKKLDGRSLRPLLENPSRTEFRDAAYTVSWRAGESIRTDRWRYNRWGNTGEELYDHHRDPNEFTNLAGKPQHATDLDRMRTLLNEKRAASKP
jgi:iduronate 2-sulfatase